MTSSLNKVSKSVSILTHIATTSAHKAHHTVVRENEIRREKEKEVNRDSFPLYKKDEIGYGSFCVCVRGEGEEGGACIGLVRENVRREGKVETLKP